MYLEDVNDLVNNRVVKENDAEVSTENEYGNIIVPDKIKAKEIEEPIDR